MGQHIVTIVEDEFDSNMFDLHNAEFTFQHIDFSLALNAVQCSIESYIFGTLKTTTVK